MLPTAHGDPHHTAVDYPVTTPVPTAEDAPKMEEVERVLCATQTARKEEPRRNNDDPASSHYPELTAEDLANMEEIELLSGGDMPC